MTLKLAADRVASRCFQDHETACQFDDVVCAVVLGLAFTPLDAGGGDWVLSPTEGLRWNSSDERFNFHAGGVFAADAMVHETDEHPDSGVYFSLAKPILEASYDEAWRMRIAGDLIGTRTTDNLYEAFVAWEGLSWLRRSVACKKFAGE